jgi:hypothetical protein
MFRGWIVWFTPSALKLPREDSQMTHKSQTSVCFRLFRLLWFGAVTLLLVFAMVPVSNRLTRTGAVGTLIVVWLGLLVLTWRIRPVRLTLLAITVACGGFLALPERKVPDPELLRSDYLAGLRRYDGVSYSWGGENPVGIDCSGLIRRGLIDSLFLRGLRSFDAGLVRRAIRLWWNDCTANKLGDGGGLTVPVIEAESINELDHSKVLPGDLGIVSGGAHIMAYLGGNQWIEADPTVGRVITVPVPAGNNGWFESRTKVVRWNLLQR